MDTALRNRLAIAREGWGEVGEIVLDTGLVYAGEEPVQVHVRKRAHRYDVDDLGGAVARCRRAPGWLELAEQVVAQEGLNVNRRGVVSVSAVEGRDVAALVARVAETSVAVYSMLLELDDETRAHDPY